MAKSSDLFGSAPVQDRIREATRMRDGREAKRMQDEYARAALLRDGLDRERPRGTFVGRLCGRGLTLLAVFLVPHQGRVRTRPAPARWLR